MEQFNFIIELATLLILVVYAVSVLAYLKLMMKEERITFLKGVLGLGALAFAGWALWAGQLKDGGSFYGDCTLRNSHAVVDDKIQGFFESGLIKVYKFPIDDKRVRA